MKNEFYVTAYRFHVKDRNTLLIQGVAQEGLDIKKQIKVQFDEKVIEFKVEKIEKEGLRRVNQGAADSEEQWMIEMKLPSDWREGKEIVLEDQNEKKVFVLSVKKMEKRASKFEYYIDGGNVLKTGFQILGWYISEQPVKIKVYDQNGKLLSTEVKERKRNDVKAQYPECSEAEIHGFILKSKDKVPKKVKIHLENDEKSSAYELILKPSKIKKEIQKIKKGSQKILVYYQQFGVKQTLKRAGEKLLKKDSITYKAWLLKNQPSERILENQKKHHFVYEPKISIIVPLYKTPEKYLDEMIESVKSQTYGNWELCLSDGSGKNSPIKEKLCQYEKKDARIKVVYNEKQLHISDNTNEALKICTGDFIAFGDHDDLFAPNALYECVKEINRDRSVDMIYTDEDKITMDGKEHFQPHFKSDFNIDMLRSMNYICHLLVVKRSLYEKVGFLKHEFDGAQDYDFVLRCVENTEHISHIPMILYHWRAHKESTAENPESKRYAFEAGKRAVEAHYQRVGIQAEVEMGELLGIYRTKYHLDTEPLVSIIIPTKDHIEDLDKCIQSIEKRATYKNIEYIIIENNSEKEETFEYYEKLKKENPRVKLVVWEKEFNYSRINNFGVQYARGEYLLFLNNDTEIINENVIEEMLGYCMRDDVGIVGARLYYEDDTVQHAGVVVGLGGVAGHAFVGAAKDDPGYFRRIFVAQDYSAVTAACLMSKRKVFDKVKGFEETLAVAFNDIDFCMKVRKAGYLIVYNPYVELHHYESKSRGLEDTEEKIERFQGEIEIFQERWKEFLEEGDPYYSPNLTLDKNDFSLRV
ncbi:glycosyltransferase family 2 protein [Mediterraneibacter gnavus]|uniref:glycosyltransferase family 2 protein n=1 Tax=Mediterraneibacter gnavus TaxID=33038 RepID=UPI00232EFF06|nr:glycosyltransferase family 2 protein [Mediterraneibacter gnavus]MDB8710497.1 glycosyltransferase family 2 protein [Mediterraneibacter gnavus]MDB8714081.1 glycosyltransferase family 2 protein [Mediterraneibacter gnavus]